MKRIITIDIETLPIDAAVEANLFWENEEEFLNTALDGALGRILCIGYCEQNEIGKIISHGCFGWDEFNRKFEMDEPKMLTEFWDYLKGFDTDRDIIIGHNILGFDLPFIKKRSLIFGIEQTVNFSLYRYQKNPVFDTMLQFDSWVYCKQGSTSLAKLAYAFGLENPKDKITGTNVFEAFQAGEYQKIHDYCKADVKTTHLIWRKLTGRNTAAKSMALAG